MTRRPEPQAIWRRTLSEEWRRMADAAFLRDARSDAERGEWRLAPKTPTAGRWSIFLPEDAAARAGWGSRRSSMWGSSPSRPPTGTCFHDECRKLAGDSGGAKVLNLFAYTGGATPAARAAGAERRTSIR